jgi:hypothetical protein
MLALATAARWLLGTRAGLLTAAAVAALLAFGALQWLAYERGRSAEEARQVQEERDRTLRQLDLQRRMDDAASTVPRDRDGLAGRLRDGDF